MTYYNPTTNHFYRSGALKTAEGTIFNPNAETLKAHGFEPYMPPEPEEPQPPTAEDITRWRKAAYVQRVDPITCEISRLRDMGGTPEEIEVARIRRILEVEAIKAEYPYPEE